MSNAFSQWLADGPLLLDGGWGTQLQQKGLPLGALPDLWNITDPDKVEEVADSYVRAGSDIILTNTFGANKFLLSKQDAADQVAEVNRRGVAISKKAAEKSTNRKVRVFASIGPTGVILMMGEVSEEDLFGAFLDQARAIKEGGADAVVCETMSDPQEAALAVRAVKEVGLPCVASMTFDSGKNKDRTMMGTTPEQEVELMTAAGADAIGSNCGQGIEGFVAICKRMRALTDLPLWMKGNAGLPQIIDGKTVYSQTPEHFAETAKILIQEGAGFIGGCCGTSPDYIAELRKWI